VSKRAAAFDSSGIRKAFDLAAKLVVARAEADGPGLFAEGAKNGPRRVWVASLVAEY